MPELDWSDMPIHQAIKSDWKSPEILIEGSLNCGKSTVFLDKEIDALLKWPGIPVLIFRWAQDAVDTKLRPAFEELLAIRGLTSKWEATEKRYVFENGSMAYMFGLKAVSLVEQFNKIRGLGVARISGDQIEEMAPQVAAELRGRLRPNLTATILGRRFPFQMTFVSNSEDDDFWLSREFPVDNHIKGRMLYQLSVFDNKYLPKESLESLLRQWPEDHPKHRTMILGRRGPNVYGVPVFDGLYRKELHWRPVDLRKDLPILESYEIGKHNPCWIFGQTMPAGGLAILGGVLGLGLVLEDFVPLVQRYRQEWYPLGVPVKTCVAPMGDKVHGGSRYTGLDVLRAKLGVQPVWAANGNAPDVRFAMIENLSTYLRRRNARGDESFAINNDPMKFLIVDKQDGPRESPIVHHAFEGGLVWSEHESRVSHKQVIKPKEDDKFENVVHCIENIELNYAAGRPTRLQNEERIQKERERQGQRIAMPSSWLGY